MINNTKSILAFVLFTSCGSMSSYRDEGTRPQQTTTDSPTKVPAAAAPNDPTNIKFKGFLGGAFPITVDGIPYDDSEDFYTQELNKIPEKLRAAGYDGSWKWRFDAVVGFQDLRNNMMVYIAPQENKGFQGESPVSYAGGFEIDLPREALETNYRVRAVKRVSVVLERGSDSVKLCYNFSAIDKNVPLTEKSKPIILDQFNTRITAYSCSVDSVENGIKIPSAPSADKTKKPQDPAAKSTDAGL